MLSGATISKLKKKLEYTYTQIESLREKVDSLEKEREDAFETYIKEHAATEIDRQKEIADRYRHEAELAQQRYQGAIAALKANNGQKED